MCADGRTDRHDLAFRNFANAPNINIASLVTKQPYTAGSTTSCT